MNWSQNTKVRTTKARQAIGAVWRFAKNRLSRSHMFHLVYQKCLPIFMYGCNVCYPTGKGDRLMIERLNRFAARVTLNDFTSSYGYLLRRLNVPPLYQSIAYRQITLAHAYSRGSRYQPPGVLKPLVSNPRLINRHHPCPVRPSTSNANRVTCP
jgi:hypothetical protein